MFAPAIRALLLSGFVALAGGASGCAAEIDGDDVVSSESALGPSGVSTPSELEASYATVESLGDRALKRALFDLVKDHTRLGYNRARTVLFGDRAFFESDGKIECQYTGRRIVPTGGRTPDGFNTEHSWPQSRGASSEPARSDLHHLFPVDARANSSRGNWPFGSAGCLHDDTAPECSFREGGSARGKDESGAYVFEVRPERRGNSARALFYFSVRYELAISAKEEKTLRAWHEEDPVDADEQHRNDAIETYQHNRNPFVDRPDFVAKISDF